MTPDEQAALKDEAENNPPIPWGFTESEDAKRLMGEYVSGGQDAEAAKDALEEP
jgi:hypothetical protein